MKEEDFKIGDSVFVRKGVIDPDYDIDISGWQGRITRINRFIEIQWDSITLKNMPLELLLECGLVRKHQFGQTQAHYEKCYFDKQHDHLILSNGEVIEFCDPRIQSIKKTIEEVFNVDIINHSLYFYGNKKNPETKQDKS